MAKDLVSFGKVVLTNEQVKEKAKELVLTKLGWLDFKMNVCAPNQWHVDAKFRHYKPLGGDLEFDGYQYKFFADLINKSVWLVRIYNL